MFVRCACYMCVCAITYSLSFPLLACACEGERETENRSEPKTPTNKANSAISALFGSLQRAILYARTGCYAFY